MKYAVSAALLALIAAPAMAEPSCTPGDAVKPVWEVIKAFEEAGGKMIAFKMNDGACYEIYGEEKGEKVEIWYDPNTGVELGRG